MTGKKITGYSPSPSPQKGESLTPSPSSVGRSVITEIPLDFGSILQSFSKLFPALLLSEGEGLGGGCFLITKSITCSVKEYVH